MKILSSSFRLLKFSIHFKDGSLGDKRSKTRPISTRKWYDSKFWTSVELGTLDTWGTIDTASIVAYSTATRYWRCGLWQQVSISLITQEYIRFRMEHILTKIDRDSWFHLNTKCFIRISSLWDIISNLLKKFQLNLDFESGLYTYVKSF